MVDDKSPIVKRAIQQGPLRRIVERATGAGRKPADDTKKVGRTSAPYPLPAPSPKYDWDSYD